MEKRIRTAATNVGASWQRLVSFVRDTLPARYQHGRFPALLIMLVAGIAVTGMIVLTMRVRGDSGETGANGAELAEASAPDYPRGPHGARLLSDGPLQLEVTIYETGVPPQFRVFPYDAGLRPVDPDSVNLRIELHRLGGRVDSIAFRAEADYLVGDAVVEEPHSFDVKIFAQRRGRRHEFAYSQIEGKVQLGADQVASTGIVIGTAGPRRMVTTIELPGQIKADETRLAHVVARLQGVVTNVLKQEGDRVRRGELLAVLNSRELADAKSVYITASRQVEFTRVTLNREEALWKKKISAERDYLEAKRAFDEAELRERLAAQTLGVLGVTRGELLRLADAPAESMARYEIRAPLDGRVIARNVTAGEAVTADEDIFTVADLSSVWVDVTVYAKDLAMVREQQEATIRSSDLGTEATGRVSFIGPLVGQETRAATARIVLPNPRGQWRPGLFVTVRLVRESAVVPLVVSIDALQTFRDWQVVFVRYGDWFEARPVELGRRDEQWVEVVKGLSPGEQYAAANSFAVKAEIGKLGASHDH